MKAKAFQYFFFQSSPKKMHDFYLFQDSQLLSTNSKQIFILEWRSEQIYLLSQVSGLSNTY